MLQQCANPICTARFMYFHDGKVFVEPRGSAIADAPTTSCQYVWLCNSCVHHFTIRYEARKTRFTVRRKTPSEYRNAA